MTLAIAANEEVSHEWIIYTNDPDDGPSTAYLGAVFDSPAVPGGPLPDSYSPYEIGNDSIPDLRVRRVRVLETDIPTEWIYQVAYGQLSNDDASESDPDPTNWATRYRMEWRNETIILEKDKDDVPILNSAGQRFDPPEHVEESYPVFVATRWETDYTSIVTKAQDYANATNIDAPYYAGVGEALMRPITFGDAIQQNGFKVWPVTYRVALRGASGETWDRYYLNQGTSARPAAGQAAQRIRDKNLNTVSGPVNLAANGTELPQNGDPTFAGPFRVRNEAEFIPLDL